MDAVKVEHLIFSYDQEVTVINDMSFSIKKGSYTTIIGHNGSGKSTIAKLLIGLLEANEGCIYVHDHLLNLDNLETIRDIVGIVFQNPDNQFIGATVADDIAFGLENKQVETEKMQSIIDTYANLVGMQKFLQSEPTKLSGGQKQRVAIAGVLAMQPNILIFDEATSMLDPQGKEEILSIIRKLHKETNMTIISITHDMDEVSESDHVIVLEKGKKVLEGKPSDILKQQEKLIQMNLDVPFAYRLSKTLKEKGLPINESVTMEQVVENLCQLHYDK